MLFVIMYLESKSKVCSIFVNNGLSSPMPRVRVRAQPAPHMVHMAYMVHRSPACRACGKYAIGGCASRGGSVCMLASTLPQPSNYTCILHVMERKHSIASEGYRTTQHK
jgi:hypothetical protein